MSKKVKQKKTKKRTNLDSLHLGKTTRVRRELIDADYLNKLSPEELEWYARFMDEYISANVKKNEDGTIKSEHLHNTVQLAKDCYDRNNRRNNDIHSVTKANGLLLDLATVLRENDGWYIHNHGLSEEAMIAIVDENARLNEKANAKSKKPIQNSHLEKPIKQDTDDT